MMSTGLFPASGLEAWKDMHPSWQDRARAR